ncbi:glycoside hydrolase superfamily [Dimargaris cristalligena]|uniref:Glycoside hydrolase superfamily n=1 Tax=Dimargaris cristalligena TaxID=215637 RepID=A0A4P9ZPA6_9FUNG|nr:glycoside hydrolase superfamily [Dimargaris cristalligena]|eukprot:RKP35028.1 glycoside hydrolase superfamily [Dimargaris cristalligena]
MVQLYTEDTYKVPDEPFFGYLRGPYTYHELSDIDNYAFNLGVEVIPCIQTLGHLGQILQWPRFAHVRDTSEVLLSKFDETYDVTAPFRSKRIHIGMDEAHGVGEGRFREFYGHEEGTKIFVDHLKRVTDICRTMDLKPMIWSDMLFCLAAKNNALHAYYDQNNTAASEHVIDCLPPDLELVFWNYYHTDPEIYAKKLQQHRELGCANPWMAGGAWTWNRLWCSLPFTLESNQASLTVSKRANGGVDHYMLTIWGDEGNECDFFSALPALVFVAHHGYTPAERIDHSFMTHSFASICGGHFDDWVHASKLDEAPPPIHNPSGAPGPDARMLLPPNLSKWLLWEDPFLSFMSPQYTGFDLEDHYQKLSSHLFRAAGQRQRYPLNLRLQLPARLAQVLAHKCHLRERMVYAYRCGNLYQLYELVSTRLEPLIRHTRMLWQYHRALWMYMYKPYGWEVVELRYGGLLTRMQTMRDRIMRYVECQSSKIAGNQQQQQQQQQSQHNAASGFPLPYADSIPEFEEDLQAVYEHAGTMLLLDYGRVTTPSRLG